MSENRTRHDPSRRTFLATAGVLASAAVIGLHPRSALASGASLRHLSQSDNALAKSFGYEPNAKDVDRAKFSMYKPGEHCSKCRFFKGTPNEKSGYAGCQLYPGFSVNAQGWCSSYNARS